MYKFYINIYKKKKQQNIPYIFLIVIKTLLYKISDCKKNNFWTNNLFFKILKFILENIL